jgi:hypothetical protein
MICPFCDSEMKMVKQKTTIRYFECECGWEQVECFEPNSKFIPNNGLNDLEVNFLEELINEKIEQLKSLEQCQATKNDIQVFENILNKIK